MIHTLKILPCYFYGVKKGIKSFEIRKDDRFYSEGDYLILCEYIPKSDYDFNNFGYTEAFQVCRVKGVFSLPDYLKEGYVIMSITRPLNLKKLNFDLYDYLPFK
jgi:hypothetical protein